LPATLSAREAHRTKQAPRVPGVLPIFHERWSPRSFSGREVSRESLAHILEAARWAASSSNEQPWRYLVGVRGSSTYDRIFASLVDSNQKWARTAPVLMLGTALANFQSGKPNRFAFYDLGAATSYMTLEAASLGLAAHQMAGYDQDKARELLGIPSDCLTGSVIALGYQDDPEKLADERLIGMETSPRQRKPLREFVFEAWGKPLDLG